MPNGMSVRGPADLPAFIASSTFWIRGCRMADTVRASSSKTMRCMSPLLGFTSIAFRSHRAAAVSLPFRRWQMPRPERQPKCRGLSSRTRRQSSIDSSNLSARKSAVARLFHPSAYEGAASTTCVKAFTASVRSPAPMSRRPSRMVMSTASSPEGSQTAQSAASVSSTTSGSSLLLRIWCSASSASSVAPGGVASTWSLRTASRRAIVVMLLSSPSPRARCTRSRTRLSRAVTGHSTSAVGRALRRRAASS
mmetsp:Transcript_74732/g.222850  ORF Transcript_74732/g.222850 Transcript_74732/m.222850 type:complete len:251 (-) Transcript_74732:383-1135(-)